MAEYLTNNGRMEVLELAQGLEIRTNSWVGRVVLGDLTITIQPKITGGPMLHLLRYAYGGRRCLL